MGVVYVIARGPREQKIMHGRGWGEGAGISSEGTSLTQVARAPELRMLNTCGSHDLFFMETR